MQTSVCNPTPTPCKWLRSMTFRKVNVEDEDARLILPVYLEEDVQRYLDERAESKGMDVSQLVNEMLRRDIALIETVK